ncbi:hypothetical protein [Halosimplex sp. TS25]|uniref:hypothetical protein n=1 Tax=Halosimplex rarum TaxID=3396619 RepID=UPI0039E7E44A
MSKSIIPRLIIGLLPFDVDALIALIKEIKDEAGETSWSAVSRIIANVGLLLASVGIVGTGLSFYFDSNTGNLFSQVPDLGLGYWFGILVVVGMIFVKYLLTLAKGIDTATSPFGEHEEAGFALLAMETIAGMAFLTILGLFIQQTIFGWLRFITILSFMAVFLGFLIAGIALVGSGIYGFGKIAASQVTARQKTLEESMETED